jgi:thiamine biosynthesis lipoprotein ApbE
MKFRQLIRKLLEGTDTYMDMTVQACVSLWNKYTKGGTHNLQLFL